MGPDRGSRYARCKIVVAAISTATSAARAVAIRRSATARSTDTVTCRSRRPGPNGRACAG